MPTAAQSPLAKPDLMEFLPGSVQLDEDGYIGLPETQVRFGNLPLVVGGHQLLVAGPNGWSRRSWHEEIITPGWIWGDIGFLGGGMQATQAQSIGNKPWFEFSAPSP